MIANPNKQQKTHTSRRRRTAQREDRTGRREKEGEKRTAKKKQRGNKTPLPNLLLLPEGGAITILELQGGQVLAQERVRAGKVGLADRLLKDDTDGLLELLLGLCQAQVEDPALEASILFRRQRVQDSVGKQDAGNARLKL